MAERKSSKGAGTAGKRGKQAKAQRDAVAASIILQSFLDSQMPGGLPPLPQIE